MQDSDISVFVEMMEDMEAMATTMTSGAGKMLPIGWSVAIVADPPNMQFLVGIAAPPISGVSKTDFPAIMSFALQELPITDVKDFTAFMERTLATAQAAAESRMKAEIARKSLTAKGTLTATVKPANAGDWFEATGTVTGPLSAAVAAREGGRPTQSRTPELLKATQHALSTARAEEEARRSILREIAGQVGDGDGD